MASQRIKGITIELGADASKFTKALAEVDKMINTTATNLRDLNKALKLDPTNVSLIRDKQRELGDQIKQTEEKIQQEKDALEAMKNTEGFDANSKAAKDLQMQIDLDTAELKNLKKEAAEVGSVFGAAFKAAGDQISAVGEKIKGVGDKISAIGSSLTTKVTTPIVGAFAASTKAAIDWESAFTGVQKTVDATSEEFDQLAENIQQMATETASSANDIAGVMEIAGQLGISGVDNLTNFTRTMVQLGDTTNLSAEEAATALARFMNITGESTENVDKIGSAIVDLGNNFATSESEITEMATRLASAGTIAGMSSTDILALSAAMSSVGIQAEAGGTAMTQTLTAMTAAVANFEAGSVDDLEAIANVANMTAQDFADSWKNEPVQAVQAFISGLGALDEKGENATLVLDELGMSGVRQSNMLKSLALASDVLTDAVDKSTEAYKENSALANEAELRYGTMASQLSQLKASATELAVSFGNLLMPYVAQLVDKAKEVVEWLNNLDESQKNMIIRVAAVAAAIGPALIVIGKVISGVGSIIVNVGKLTNMLGSVMTALSALSGPIAIVIAAIAALVAGFVYLYNTNEEFRTSVQQTVEQLKTNFAAMLEAIQPQLDAIAEAFRGFMDAITPILDAIFTYLMGVINGIIAAIEPLMGVVSEVINYITNIINAFIALMQGDFDGFSAYMQAALNNLINIVLGVIQAFVAFVVAFFNTFGVNIKAIFTTMWNNIKTIVSTVTAAIKTEITNKFNAIKSWLETTLTTIKNKFNETFENIKRGVSEKIQNVKETIVNGIQAACDYIASLPGRFYSWGCEMIDSLINGIKEKIGGIADAIGGVAETISSYIHFSEPDVGPLKDFHTFMPDMIKEMVDGINQSIPELQKAVSGMATTLAPSVMGAGASGSTTTNTVTLNIYGAQGQSVEELGYIIQENINHAIYAKEAVFR